MSWVYHQRSGTLVGPNGEEYYGEYSGAPQHQNNPGAEHIANSGPIPRGSYRIGDSFNSRNTGDFVLPLSPVGHTAHGRTDFQIHGERRNGPQGNASSGCIIYNLDVRRAVDQSTDKMLEVRE